MNWFEDWIKGGDAVSDIGGGALGAAGLPLLKNGTKT